MRILILLAMLAVLSVVGCAQPVIVPVPPPAPTAIEISDIEANTPVPPTLVPPSEVVALAVPPASSTPTPSLTPTNVPSPTRTLTPAPTYTPTRTITPTVTHTPTLKPSATPYPIPSGNITRLDVNFFSASLQLDRELIIYLPPGYNASPQRRYPVLYLLHGFGGFNLQHTTEWEQWGLMNVAQEAMTKGTARPMIIVQPNAFMIDGQCSLFFNHGPGTDGKPWGDYIWKDVVNYIDANYRTIPNRESRAIGGFSFGGQGALSLALLHPEVFAFVGAHRPSFRTADGSIPFINDWNYFNQYDPIWLVQNKDTARQLGIWMDVATADDEVRNCGTGSDHCVEAFHALLVARGIPHDFHDTWPGPHEGSYWIGHTPDYLAWYSSKLIGQ